MNLSMQLPQEFVSAINRRYEGSPHTREEIAKAVYLMNKFFSINQKYKEKENYLLEVEWEEKKIEQHYGSNLFNNAHIRLRRYRKIIHDTHKSMFYLLISIDGNTSETFSEFECVSAKEIYDDFNDKYLGEKNIK